MLIVNIVLLVLLLSFIGMGLKDGFVHSLGRLVGAVIGFVAARAWSLPVGSVLALFMPVGIARLIAFIFIFLLITQLVGFAFKLVDGLFKIVSFIPFLKSINSLLGAIAGLVEGVIIIGGVIFLIHGYLLEPHLVAWTNSSIVAQNIEKVFKLLLAVLL